MRLATGVAAATSGLAPGPSVRRQMAQPASAAWLLLCSASLSVASSDADALSSVSPAGCVWHFSTVTITTASGNGLCQFSVSLS